MAAGNRRGLDKKEKESGLELVIPDEIEPGFVYIVDVKVNNKITSRTSYSVIYHEMTVDRMQKRLGKEKMTRFEITNIIGKNKQNF